MTEVSSRHIGPIQRRPVSIDVGFHVDSSPEAIEQRLKKQFLLDNIRGKYNKILSLAEGQAEQGSLSPLSPEEIEFEMSQNSALAPNNGIEKE